MVGIVTGVFLTFTAEMTPTHPCADRMGRGRRYLSRHGAGSDYGITPQHIIDHAADVDDGRYFVLFVSLAAVLASLTAIALELQSVAAGSTARDDQVGLVLVTVALSWLFVHTSFAKHYAHEYYGPADAGGIRKGLVFPGNEAPDFGDFFHFAMVIGVAAQTADIQIAAKSIRRVVTLHGVLAFLFNTVILALTLSLVSNLFN